MAKKVEKEVEEVEETADTEVEEEEEVTDQADQADGTDSEDADEEGSEHSDNDRDLDAEIEEEEKLAEGDEPEVDDEEEGEENKPVTRKELRKFEKSTLEATALALATGLTETDKEARLVLATWKNRRYPKGMPLAGQVKEAYLVKFGANLMGQTEEAKRALLNRRRVNTDSAGTHRDRQINTNEPKMSAVEKQNLERIGFKYVPERKRYEKKVRGGVVVRDPKTHKTRLERSR